MIINQMIESAKRFLEVPLSVRLLYFLNNTSLFVSIGAAFTCAFGFVIADQQIVLTHVLNAFFLTWCAYQFIKPIQSGYRNFYRILACTGAGINALFLPLHFILPVVICAALTLGYRNQWTGGPEKARSRFALRNNGWTKTLATSLAWTLVTSWWMVIALLEFGHGWLFGLLSLSQFLWIAALALAGDLRDTELDRAGPNTLPVMWGKQKARWIITLLFILSAVIAILIGSDQSLLSKLLISGVYIVAIGINWVIRPSLNWHRITLALDGLLILRGLVVFVSPILGELP